MPRVGLDSVFFDTPAPRVVAHRGFTLRSDEEGTLAENSIDSFRAAIAAGVSDLETDTHATKDGIAVLFHDDDLVRAAGDDRKIVDLTLAELRAATAQAGGVCTLSEALAEFPQARFNIDVKSADAVAPTALAVLQATATHRVLLSSFSNSRRRSVLALVPGVATSASALLVVPALLAAKLRIRPLVRSILAGVDAVQIPERIFGLRTSSASMIDAFHHASVEVHFWTINDPADMQRLRRDGADAIVTDRADLAVKLFSAPL